MATVTIKEALRSREPEKLNYRSNALCQQQSQSFRNFLTKWNCDLQSRCGANITQSYFGNYPTLSQLNRIYGDNAAITWLLPQLYNLSEYCGVRDKLQGRPLEECANIIAIEYHWLKVSEIMLFLYWFKAGRYGHMYGVVDPLVITTALRQFVSERGDAYAKREQEEREKREAAQPKGITWEEYCAKHGIKNKPNPLGL